MRTLIVASCLLAGALFLPTVTLAETDPAPPLASSSWRVQDTTGEISQDIPFGITFEDDVNLTVQTGCPEADGTYEVLTDGAITIDVDDAALGDCEEAQATAFISQIELAESWVVDENGLLTLSLSDGESLVFDPALIGVTWQWLEFQSSNDAVGTTVATEVNQVEFNQDGTVTIDTPCAGGSGSFQDTADGLNVDLSDIDTSDCAADSSTALLLRDLDMATSYVIRDGQLFVALPMDGGIHQFEPVYDAPAAE